MMDLREVISIQAVKDILERDDRRRRDLTMAALRRMDAIR